MHFFRFSVFSQWEHPPLTFIAWMKQRQEALIMDTILSHSILYTLEINMVRIICLLGK